MHKKRWELIWMGIDRVRIVSIPNKSKNKQISLIGLEMIRFEMIRLDMIGLDMIGLKIIGLEMIGSREIYTF